MDNKNANEWIRALFDFPSRMYIWKISLIQVSRESRKNKWESKLNPATEWYLETDIHFFFVISFFLATLFLSLSIYLSFSSSRSVYESISIEHARLVKPWHSACRALHSGKRNLFIEVYRGDFVFQDVGEISRYYTHFDM